MLFRKHECDYIKRRNSKDLHARKDPRRRDLYHVFNTVYVPKMVVRIDYFGEKKEFEIEEPTKEGRRDQDKAQEARYAKWIMKI